jgi:Family of unknown function (DUF6064)
MPPFSRDDFFSVFIRYNESMWPLPLLLVAAGLAFAVLTSSAPRRSHRLMAMLAALWAYAAIAYHLAFLTSLTPAGLVFAALFLAEAALLAWHGLRTRRLHLAVPLDRASRLAGAALVAYALIGYPAVAELVGQRYPAVPTFGLPCPTTIFTFGVLTWCVRPVPRSVLVVPLLWTLVAMSAAITFGIVEDFALPIAAVVTLIVLHRRTTHTSTSASPRRPLQLGF